MPQFCVCQIRDAPRGFKERVSYCIAKFDQVRDLPHALVEADSPEAARLKGQLIIEDRIRSATPPYRRASHLRLIDCRG